MVSIIVPVYNAEKYISKCINSILNQTYPYFELILIDDGSKDSSLLICNEYQMKDNRIRVISQINKGVSETRNKGIKEAKGDYIQFVDSDDELVPTMLEKLVAEIKKEDVDLVICGYNEILSGKTNIVLPDKEGNIYKKNLNKEYPNIFDRFLLNAVWNKLYKKEKIQYLFLSNLSMGEDLLFNLSYLKDVQSISFIKEALYNYYIYENSLTRKIRNDYIQIAEKLYIESKKFCNDVELSKQGYNDISNVFIKFLFYGLSDIYYDNNLSISEKYFSLEEWINNSNVREAISLMNSRSLKLCLICFLVKHKIKFILHILLLIKNNRFIRR